MIIDKSLTPDVIFFSILTIFIPIALITGPALPDIFLSLIAFYFLIKSFLLNLWNYYRNPIVFGFLTFSCYGIIRSFFSEMPIESLSNEGSVFYFRYIFFCLGIWYLLDINKYLSKCFLIISITSLIVICFDGILQYLTGIDFFGTEAISPFRITGLFGNEPIMGRYISLLSLFTFVLMYLNFKKTKITIMSMIAFLIMCEVVVFLSGERVPVFYVCLFTILIIFFAPNYRIYRIVGVFISIAIVIGIVQINPNAKERMINQTIIDMNETKIKFLPYNKAYEEHYISGIKMFLDYPLFGIGTNTFRFQSQKPNYTSNIFDINSHPHQYYIQVLAEQGIVGFLFLVSFFLYITHIVVKQFYYILKSIKSKQIPFEKFLFSILLFTFWWPFIPHMSLYNNWHNVLLMLPLGFFMRDLYGKKNI
jgi:O-antigen ligase